LIQAFIIAYDIYDEGFEPNFVIPIVGMGLLFLLVIVVIAYIAAFLNYFVIPIMYKNRITTNQAWRQFLPLFSKYGGYFILFGLFLLVLYIFTVIAVITAVLLTCCIGLLLLIIPYIGSVVTLPISYTFTALGPEFLVQFGPEYDVFPRSEDMIANSQTE